MQLKTRTASLALAVSAIGVSSAMGQTRKANRRVLAGGALEALTRVGDPSTNAIVKQPLNDRWAEGRDPTALAVLFARARFLNDGSMLMIRQAMDEKSRRVQATRYLSELTPSLR